MKICEHIDGDNKRDCDQEASYFCQCCLSYVCSDHLEKVCPFGGMTFLDGDDE